VVHRHYHSEYQYGDLRQVLAERGDRQRPRNLAAEVPHQVPASRMLMMVTDAIQSR